MALTRAAEERVPLRSRHRLALVRGGSRSETPTAPKTECSPPGGRGWRQSHGPGQLGARPGPATNGELFNLREPAFPEQNGREDRTRSRSWSRSRCPCPCRPASGTVHTLAAPARGFRRLWTHSGLFLPQKRSRARPSPGTGPLKPAASSQSPSLFVPCPPPLSTLHTPSRRADLPAGGHPSGPGAHRSQEGGPGGLVSGPAPGLGSPAPAGGAGSRPGTVPWGLLPTPAGTPANSASPRTASMTHSGGRAPTVSG